MLHNVHHAKLAKLLKMGIRFGDVYWNADLTLHSDLLAATMTINNHCVKTWNLGPVLFVANALSQGCSSVERFLLRLILWVCDCLFNNPK